MNILLFVKFLYRIIKYYLSNTKRYAFLLNSIFKRKPKSILEIGVYNGNRAVEMIETAKIFNKDIIYYGFDLFEDFYKNKKLLKNELSKNPLSKKKIINKLSNFEKIKLIKGNTISTLHKFVKSKKEIDFAFIDGGHSLNTIKKDWKNINKLMSENSLVIFDDYYELISKKKINAGCNKVINSLPKKKYTSFKYPIGDIFFDKYNKINKKIFMVSVKKHDL
tara:strand:- start:3251 stop:3913 length:663 start_codon:yes stop_codon:yes gene_type:complete